MLRSFRLQNHRSFLDEAELSLLPTHRSSRPAVPVTAIYGANAAGKSNLLDGLQFMATAVRDSHRRWDPSAGLPRRPFALSVEGNRTPSTFVVDLMLKGVRHVYGFVVDDGTVLEEWLHTYPHHRRRVLFARDGDGIVFGRTVTGPRVETEVLADLIRPTALFLSLAAHVGLREFLPVHEWFVRGLRWAGDPRTRALSEDAPSLSELIAHGAQRRERVLRMIRAVDEGITDVVTDQDGTAGSLSQRILFDHGNGVLFDIAEESAGTRSWVAKIPHFLWAMEEGGTLVIDEIDTSLHPHLMVFLIGLFASEENNTEGAQLLFTTRNASLLGTVFGDELLKRDQIWFVEKDGGGQRTSLSRGKLRRRSRPRRGPSRCRSRRTGPAGQGPGTGSGSEPGSGSTSSSHAG